LALKFYELYKTDPQHFVPQYIALMKNGFDAPPSVLLKHSLGLDINDPHLIPRRLVWLMKGLNYYNIAMNNPLLTGEVSPELTLLQGMTAHGPCRSTYR
jgi:hypothetical protein